MEIPEKDKKESLSGRCHCCKKVAKAKCSRCKGVFYCNHDCQKQDWKEHKAECKKTIPYKLKSSVELGRYLVANRDLKKGEVVIAEAPLVVGPSFGGPPMCVACYKDFDGSYRSRKTGWLFCNKVCEDAIANNPEVFVPHQTRSKFASTAHLNDSILPMRTLFLQTSSPSKFQKVLNLESHFDERKGTEDWEKCQKGVVDVMKNTLGLKLYQRKHRDIDLSDDMIQRVVGILETNILQTQGKVSFLFETASMLEHSCTPNLGISYDSNDNITIRAGRDISCGEHLSITYVSPFLGTYARREQLFKFQRFWCNCPRCADPSELGSELSTVIVDGKEVRPVNPLDQNTRWKSSDGSLELRGKIVLDLTKKIDSQMMILFPFDSKAIAEDLEFFLEKFSLVLHQNHYHMAKVKLMLLQIYGRETLPDIKLMRQLKRKSSICKEFVLLCDHLDPLHILLKPTFAVVKFEMHLPFVISGYILFASGCMSIDEYREFLKKPMQLLKDSLELLADCHPRMVEFQTKLNAEEDLSRLETFMMMIGCE